MPSKENVKSNSFDQTNDRSFQSLSDFSDIMDFDFIADRNKFPIIPYTLSQLTSDTDLPGTPSPADLLNLKRTRRRPHCDYEDRFQIAYCVSCACAEYFLSSIGVPRQKIKDIIEENSRVDLRYEKALRLGRKLTANFFAEKFPGDLSSILYHLVFDLSLKANANLHEVLKVFDKEMNRDQGTRAPKKLGAIERSIFCLVKKFLQKNATRHKEEWLTSLVCGVPVTCGYAYRRANILISDVYNALHHRSQKKRAFEYRNAIHLFKEKENVRPHLFYAATISLLSGMNPAVLWPSLFALRFIFQAIVPLGQLIRGYHAEFTIPQLYILMRLCEDQECLNEEFSMMRKLVVDIISTQFEMPEFLNFCSDALKNFGLIDRRPKQLKELLARSLYLKEYFLCLPGVFRVPEYKFVQ